MPPTTLFHPSIRHKQRSISRSVISMSTVSGSTKKGELLPCRNIATDHNPDLSTPYRLPRMSQTNSLTSHSHIQLHDGKSRILNYLGYRTKNVDTDRSSVDPLVWKIYVPPKSFVQQMRQSNLAVPQFQAAAIAPSLRSPGFDDLLHYKSVLHEKTKHSGENKCTTTPVSCPGSAAKSGKSLRWTLGTENPNFAKKGRPRAQGPYSREFTVTCMPPTNWLKMKLGRIPPRPIFTL